MLTYTKTANLNEIPFAAIACSIYILGFALQLTWDIPMILLVLIGNIAIYTVDNSKSQENSKLNYSVLFFLVALIFSIIFSQQPLLSLTLSMAMLPALYIYYLIAFVFFKTSQIRLIYLCLSLLCLIISFGLIITVIVNPLASPTMVVKIFSSPILVVPNDTVLLAIIAPLSMALLRHNHFRVIKLIAASSLLLSFITIILLQSRGALVAMLIAFTIFSWKLWQTRALIIIMFTLISLVLVDGSVGFPLLSKIFSTVHGRYPLWDTAWKMFIEQPVFGLGQHMFAQNYSRYNDALLIPWAHNLYLETLAEQGLFGFSALLVLLMSGLRKAWTLSNLGVVIEQKSINSSEIPVLALAAFCALFAFCIAAVYELTLIRVWVPIILFLLLGIIVFLAQVQKCDSR